MLLDFIKYRRIWYAVSVFLLIPGIISLSLWGLNLGIDFTGGSLMEIQTKNGVTVEQVRQAVGDQYGNPVAQSTGDDTFQLKLQTLDPDQRNQVLSTLNQQLGGEVVEERFETVGPTIGADLTRKAILSVVLGSLLIVAYIAYAFRNVPKPASGWRFGATTIFALLHDILFTLGVFSLLGHFAGVEIDANFVAAVLTVIGFSVHDTIVVFDRIRENLIKGQGATLEDTVNLSISQTLVRSINTSVTVLLVLGAMLLYGGASIHYFVLALFVGIAIGTYSSIFNAAPVLVSWQRWTDKRSGRK